MKENQTIDPKKEIPNKEDKHMDYFWNACVPEERAEIIVSIREKVFQKIRQIDPSLAKKHSTRRIVWLSTAIAASLLLGVWTIKWVLTEKSSVDIRLLAQQMEMNVEKVPEQVTLIVSEKKKIQIGETAQIKYDHSGGLTVDEKNVNEKESKKESQLLQYNQLIVPKGKRSKVQLSDGTEMWINSGKENTTLTSGGGLNGEGSRSKIVGEEGKQGGFYFINAIDETETAVPTTSLLRNEPSSFSFIIPSLPKRSYHLEVATQYGGNSKQLLKEVRRNRFPYLLEVQEGGNDRPDEV